MRGDNGKYWDYGWQLVEGCDPVSPGCANCWSLAKEARFRQESGIVFHAERLNRKFRQAPAVVNIWNDLFHEEIRQVQQLKVWDVVHQYPQHAFITLTKRAEKMRSDMDCFGVGAFPENLWLGVTAENQEMADARIPVLMQIPAAKRIVSIEPLLGEMFIGPHLYSDYDRAAMNSQLYDGDLTAANSLEAQKRQRMWAYAVRMVSI